MKLIFILSFLILSSCTSFNRHEEVMRIYGEFESSAKENHKEIPSDFRFDYIVAPIPLIGNEKPLAACAPKHTKKYYETGGDSKWQTYWNSLSPKEQNQILSYNQIIFLDVTWENLNRAEKEIVLFHELGHCAFGLPHAAEPCKNDLMCDRVTNINTSNYTSHKQNYLKSLMIH